MKVVLLFVALAAVLASTEAIHVCRVNFVMPYGSRMFEKYIAPSLYNKNRAVVTVIGDLGQDHEYDSNFKKSLVEVLATVEDTTEIDLQAIAFPENRNFLVGYNNGCYIRFSNRPDSPAVRQDQVPYKFSSGMGASEIINVETVY
eukprot:CAMPEP_0119118448 /NCGR_PEP_ID=MMETSP1310-20130426/326_1 /TAXON_ID=464262 /ORGANISM="Genus nov. species nov., Strain RCC2339" /LENGTH=144 /DNA_ID=CAMNT_0007107815 /DNA_START=160 /DNA_END=594 /DNA_ORIENTATION=+